jgi:dienelactone hydrolase
MIRNNDGNIDWRIIVISFLVALAYTGAAMAASEKAGQGGPKQEAYDPPSGQGPLVILISGSSGFSQDYRNYATEVARLGYYAVLLDGNDFRTTADWDDEATLRRADEQTQGILRHTIEQAQGSPKALPGKVAVIGFSMGGGGALAYAAGMPDIVSAVVTYYPMTFDVSDMRSFTAHFQVPILVLAGETDNYMDCCLIESMREMEAAAKESGKSFKLVVYPNAYHGFIRKNWAAGVHYRAQDTTDAWQRITGMLRQYQPLH